MFGFFLFRGYIDNSPFTVAATPPLETWHQLQHPIKSMTARAAVYLCMHTHTLYTLLISSAVGLWGLRAPADNILFGRAAQSHRGEQDTRHWCKFFLWSHPGATILYLTLIWSDSAVALRSHRHTVRKGCADQDPRLDSSSMGGDAQT